VRSFGSRRRPTKLTTRSEWIQQQLANRWMGI
jgi:hypothetical protein